MIGWTLAAILALGILVGLTWAVKEIDGSWVKAALIIGAITGSVAAFMAAIYGINALIEAGV